MKGERGLFRKYAIPSPSLNKQSVIYNTGPGAICVYAKSQKRERSVFDEDWLGP